MLTLTSNQIHTRSNNNKNHFIISLHLSSGQVGGREQAVSAPGKREGPSCRAVWCTEKVPKRSCVPDGPTVFFHLGICPKEIIRQACKDLGTRRLGSTARGLSAHREHARGARSVPGTAVGTCRASPHHTVTTPPSHLRKLRYRGDDQLLEGSRAARVICCVQEGSLTTSH